MTNNTLPLRAAVTTDQICWSDFTERYIEHVTHEKGTQAATSRRNSLVIAADLLSVESPAELTTDDLGELLPRIVEAGYTFKSAKTHASRVRLALRWGIGQGLFEPHPRLSLDASRHMRVPIARIEAERAMMVLDAVDCVTAELRHLIAEGESGRRVGVPSSIRRAFGDLLTGDSQADALEVVRKAVLHYAEHLTENLSPQSPLYEIRTVLECPTPSEIRQECEAITSTETPAQLRHRRGIYKEHDEQHAFAYVIPMTRAYA